MESGYNEIRELSQQALERERWRLRNDNQRLNGQINRLMNSFEREQLIVSEKIQERNEQIRQESMRALVAVASGAILLAVIFGVLVWKGWLRDDRFRRALEEARRRAEDLLEAREKLMLTITHDFKAPLGSIIGYVELMMRLDNTERQKFYLQNMKASSDRERCKNKRTGSYSLETCHVFSCTLRYAKDNRRIHLLCGKKDGFCPLQVVDVKLTNCIVAGFCFVQHFFC